MALYTSEDFTVEVGSSGGIVASVDVSGGTSGLVFSGGPITGSGVITLSSGALTAVYGGTGLSGFTTGGLFFAASATAMAQDATALFWDNSNKRLGIGTASPGFQLVTTGKAVFGSAITGSADAAAPSPSWQFGDNSAVQSGSGSWSYGIVFGTNILRPVTGDSYFGIGITPTYNAGAGQSLAGSFTSGYFDAKHTSNTNTIASLRGLAAYATQAATSTGFATNSIGVQAALLYTANGTLTATNSYGVVATLRSEGTTSTTATNYTAFRVDNNASPSDGCVLSGSQNGNYNLTNLKGFYYTLTTNAPSGLEAAFMSDAVPDSTGSSTRYQLYCLGTLTYTNPGGYYVNAGSGKNYIQGRLGIGTTAPQAQFEISNTVGAGAGVYYPSGAIISQFGGAAPGTLTLRAGRGTTTSPSAVSTGDALGQIVFSGYGGASFGYPGQAIIAGRLESGSGANNAPTSVETYTGGAYSSGTSGAYGLGTTAVPTGLFKRHVVDSTGVVTMQDQPYVLATMTAAQSVNSGVATDIAFNSNLEWQGDPSRGGTTPHDPVTNNTRFTAPKAGIYMLKAQAQIVANATGYRTIAISKSGVGIIASGAEPAPSASVPAIIQATAICQLNAGDYLIVSVTQTSGGALNVTQGRGATDAVFVKVA